MDIKQSTLFHYFCPLISLGEESASLEFSGGKKCLLSAFEAVGESLRQGQGEPRKHMKELQLKPSGLEQTEYNIRMLRRSGDMGYGDTDSFIPEVPNAPLPM